MKSAQKGFTLIEIAIVLVIIGLLLGGVLKGQELVNSARVKALANEIKAVQTAFFSYQDRFRATPGDDAAAITHLGATVNGVNIVNAAGATAGDGQINSGTWVGAAVPAGGNESSLFWMHTRAAGLMTGNPASGQANNAVGGALGITNASAVTNHAGTVFVCTGGIDGRLAQQLDTTLDDGAPGTGAMQATAGAAVTAAAAAAAAPYAAGTVYTMCMSL